jgi:hypothetical protein
MAIYKVRLLMVMASLLERIGALQRRSVEVTTMCLRLPMTDSAGLSVFLCPCCDLEPARQC